MRIRLKIGITFVLFLAIISAESQEFYDSPNPLSTNSNTLNYKLTGRQYYFRENLNGTVYLNDDWELGSVLLRNGDRFENIYLKLNTFLEELIVFNERTGAIMIMDKFIIDEFELNNRFNSNNKFRNIYFDKFPKGHHYFNVIYDGKIKLFIWYQTKEVKTSVYKDDYGLLRDSEFKQEVDYFLVFPNGDVYKMAKKRSAYINLFPEQKKTVRQLFRKNKIHFTYGASEAARAVKLIEEEFFSK